MPFDPKQAMPQDFGLRYRVEELLGAGSQGQVYKAFDLQLERYVALKMLHEEMAQIPEYQNALLEEARIAAKFTYHPNYCKIYDCGTIEGWPYLSMEYIDGNTLSEFCKTSLLAPREAVAVVTCLAKALADFHKADGTPLHRDLKPSNVMLTAAPARRPILIDFGLALRLSSCKVNRPGINDIVGPDHAMSPEQAWPGRSALSHASDVYSLGTILYELLTGEPPFEYESLADLIVKIRNKVPPEPSQRRSRNESKSNSVWEMLFSRLCFWRSPAEISPSLDTVCLTAMAKIVGDRFQNMNEFADALQKVNIEMSGPAGVELRGGLRPIISRETIRFAFQGVGQSAPPALDRQNQLFLDVGNDLRAGVIDHHQIVGAGSTAKLIEHRLVLIDAAIAADGADEFRIILHTDPDLDCIVAAFLAIAYLTTGTLPENKHIGDLIEYVEKVDSGYPGMTASFPFTLYAAQQYLLARRAANISHADHWRAVVDKILTLIKYVLQMMDAESKTVDEIDAFAAPGFFGPEDRADVANDPLRYQSKLANPATGARVAQLKLPGQFGGHLELDALLVRDVQNVSDLDRVRFFKIWARSDAERSPRRLGFEALSVFSGIDEGRPPRCIISVTPGSKASLRGLGMILDEAETALRVGILGKDDRNFDRDSGEVLPPRGGGGYNSADPWYDGRSHNYTIVDSPRAGTMLSAEAIEKIFLDFGNGTAVPL